MRTAIYTSRRPTRPGRPHQTKLRAPRPVFFGINVDSTEATFPCCARLPGWRATGPRPRRRSGAACSGEPPCRARPGGRGGGEQDLRSPNITRAGPHGCCPAPSLPAASPPAGGRGEQGEEGAACRWYTAAPPPTPSITSTCCATHCAPRCACKLGHSRTPPHPAPPPKQSGRKNAAAAATAAAAAAAAAAGAASAPPADDSSASGSEAPLPEVVVEPPPTAAAAPAAAAASAARPAAGESSDDGATTAAAAAPAAATSTMAAPSSPSESSSRDSTPKMSPKSSPLLRRLSLFLGCAAAPQHAPPPPNRPAISHTIHTYTLSTYHFAVCRKKYKDAHASGRGAHAATAKGMHGVQQMGKVSQALGSASRQSLCFPLTRRSVCRANQGHTFGPFELVRPMWCDVCDNFIWGLLKECVQCECRFCCLCFETALRLLHPLLTPQPPHHSVQNSMPRRVPDPARAGLCWQGEHAGGRCREPAPRRAAPHVAAGQGHQGQAAQGQQDAARRQQHRAARGWFKGVGAGGGSGEIGVVVGLTLSLHSIRCLDPGCRACWHFWTRTMWRA